MCANCNKTLNSVSAPTDPALSQEMEAAGMTCVQGKVSESETDSRRRRERFASLVIFDTEATGSRYRRTRITEFCMLAVLTGELESSTSPRYINKLLLCFDPKQAISAEVSSLTGLYNDVLEEMATFKDQAPLISAFLTSLPQPACIIAHNGNRFDFPLLQAELQEVGEWLPTQSEIWCADSFETLRVLDGLQPVPDWLIQRENEKKRMKACANINIYNSNKVTAARKNGARRKDSGLGQGENTSAVCTSPNLSPSGNPDIAKDFQSDSSSGKRQADLANMSADDDQVLSKYSKTESLPSFGSQQSVTDAELAEAYDNAITQVSGDIFASSSQQSAAESDDDVKQAHLESTPKQDGSFVADVSSHFVKKQHVSSVSVAGREKVTRRLFDDQQSPVASPMTGTGQDLEALEDEAADCAELKTFSSTGSLSDRELLHFVQQAESQLADSLRSPQTRVEVPTALPPSPQTRVEVPTAPLQSQKENTNEDIRDCSDISNTAAQCSSASSSSRQAASDLTLCPPTPSSSSSGYSSGANSNAAPTSGKQLSYKLSEIYKREFGYYPKCCHTAEDDCVSLLRIITRKMPQFLQYVEKHAKELSSFEPMF